MPRDTKYEDLGSTKWVVVTVLVGLVGLVALMLDSLWQDPAVFNEDLGQVVPMVYEQFEIDPETLEDPNNMANQAKHSVQK